MSRKVISLSGEQQVGKDEFSKPLIRAGFNHGSFASNLKEMCQNVFHISPLLTDTQEGKMKIFDVKRDFTDARLREILRWVSKTHDLTGCQNIINNIKQQYIITPTLKTGKTTTFKNAREILQFIGTDVCRKLNPTYHIDVLQITIDKTPGNWVITDSRFENERLMLKNDFGATLIRIKRPGYEARPGAHESELSFGNDEDYNIVVNNSGTIEQLHMEAMRLL